jgi:hypothetical protein
MSPFKLLQLSTQSQRKKISLVNSMEPLHLDSLPQKTKTQFYSSIIDQ